MDPFLTLMLFKDVEMNPGLTNSKANKSISKEDDMNDILFRLEKRTESGQEENKERQPRILASIEGEIANFKAEIEEFKPKSSALELPATSFSTM